MTDAVVFALLSLCFAGLNDVVFKRYSAKERSRGILVFGIGLVGLLLQTLAMLGQGVIPRTGAATLAYGVLAGVCLTVSNILLIESLTHIEVSLGSTIYRLNTIGVALLSIVFLHEGFGTTKVAGIGIGMLAVLLLVHRSRKVAITVSFCPCRARSRDLLPLACTLWSSSSTAIRRTASDR
jgi:drug/metabolite transporter (DMT)-like permease